MQDWVSIEDVYLAYIDCRKRKRNSLACAIFESNELVNLLTLCDELNNGTYKIGPSNTFCVTRPKVREVFAADFRDRIVHHLIIGKILTYIEDYLIEDTYNCRVGKGTDYGIKRVSLMMRRHPNGWVLKCDISGFFMSINKELLADMLEDFLKERYNGWDLEEVINLIRIIVLHSPEKNCIKKGNLALWKLLPKNKSLFTNGDSFGLAIGNLTSQIFANFFLSFLDNFLSSIPGVEYGRYVDDFILICDDKKLLLDLLPQIRKLLKLYGLILHPHKIYLLPVCRGVNFLGSTIKGSRIYAGNRTVGNFINFVKYINNLENKQIHLIEIVLRYNSYSGYLVHKNSLNIRRKIFRLLDEEYRERILIKGKVQAIILKLEYTENYKILQTYGKKNFLK